MQKALLAAYGDLFGDELRPSLRLPALGVEDPLPGEGAPEPPLPTDLHSVATRPGPGASAPWQTPSNTTRRSGLWAIGGALGLGLFAAVLGSSFVGQNRDNADAPAVSSTASAAATSVVAPPPPPSIDSPIPSSAPSASAVGATDPPAASTKLTAHPTGPAPRIVFATAAPPPPVPRPSAAPSAALRCDPPYDVDPITGRKHWKADCL
jgi:hypothetical protein